MVTQSIPKDPLATGNHNDDLLPLPGNNYHENAYIKHHPKLSIDTFDPFDQLSIESSSVVSTPTTESFDLSTQKPVSFRFNSVVFYDQQLYIYEALSALYQRLAQCCGKHTHLLTILQYTIATIHGLTLYMLSVVLSLAQLTMITFTIENLEWIQTHTPLMCEWNACFPGFVFPALDIDSESEEELLENFEYDEKGERYWLTKKKLKSCDGSQTRRQNEVGNSMNSILRKRLSKYQQWISCTWGAEEEITYQESQIPGEDMFGNVKHSLSKRVTFNERVTILGNRRSGPIQQPSPYETKPSSGHTVDNTNNMHSSHTTKDHIPAPTPVISKRLSSSITDQTTLNSIIQDEQAYQAQMASRDTNGSGSSSPVLHQDIQRTPTSTDSLPVSNSLMHVAPPLPPSPSLSASYISSVYTTTSTQKHETIDMISLESFQSTSSITSSFLREKSSTDSLNSSHSSDTFSSHSSSSNTEVARLDELVPEQNPSHDNKSQEPVKAIVTRPKRSLSLRLHRHRRHGSDEPQEGKKDVENAPSEEGNDKHKNFLYRLAHPKRYKRELEQQMSDLEKQRLISLIGLQHKIILGEEPEPVSNSSDSLPRDACLGSRNGSYYYATSAEFVEGLGATDSIISTSVGTSFPEELQDKKTKSRSKQLQPLKSGTHNIDCSLNSNGSLAIAENRTQKSPVRAIFKRESKKEPGNGLRLHNLFHPHQKNDQSSPSLVRAHTIHIDGETPKHEHSSAGLRRNSRDFTSFAALGVPVESPNTSLVLPANITCPLTSTLYAHNQEMEHTKFAAFGFPSPQNSPTSSAAPSPRVSISFHHRAEDEDAKQEIEAEVLTDEVMMQPTMQQVSRKDSRVSMDDSSRDDKYDPEKNASTKPRSKSMSGIRDIFKKKTHH